jgi:hypothetical protein
MAISLYDEMKKQKQPATTTAFRQADQKASQPKAPPKAPPSQASAYATPGNPRTNPRRPAAPSATTAFRQADEQASKPKAAPQQASAYATPGSQRSPYAPSLWSQVGPQTPKNYTPPAPKSWYDQLRESDTSPGKFMTGISPARLLSGAVGVAGDLLKAGDDYLSDTPPAVVMNDAARAAALAGSVVGKVEQGKYLLASRRSGPGSTRPMSGRGESGRVRCTA